MNHQAGLRRNNDSSARPSRFNCCANSNCVRVFTQPGPKAAVRGDRQKLAKGPLARKVLEHEHGGSAMGRFTSVVTTTAIELNGI